MSKASDLRRKATEAVRAKDFDRAVELYEKVCAQDPGNGTPRNELGDVFLKLGDAEAAIASFTEAARLYQDFGLTNNAVAVHKKILRHEPNHLHSLWVLGDIRREQGLEAEASAAFLEFLDRHANVTDSEREAFVARGLQLLETMGDDPQILSALDSIFSRWDFGQERARVLVAKAALAHDAGEVEVRDKYIDHARSAFDPLEALPDFIEFLKVVDPVSAEIAIASGVCETIQPDDGDDGTIVIDDETRFDFGDVDAPNLDVEGDSPTSARIDLPAGEIDLGFDFDADAFEDVSTPPSGPLPSGTADSTVVEPIPEVELDDTPPGDSFPEPGVVLGDDPAPDSDEEVERVAWDTAPAEDDATDIEAGFDDAPAFHGDFEAETPFMTSDADESAEDHADLEDVAEEADDEPKVDLLEQILADGGFDLSTSEKDQVATIANEMQGQIGSDVADDDYPGQYELGTVYMDMALYDQAIEAFDRASDGDEERLRALEMKGTCLLRLDRVDEALGVFQEGLAVPGYPGRAYLGLLYGVGAGQEAQGDLATALEYFERVHAVDAAFLDVEDRLIRLRASVGDA